jgi:hypothetical protein
MRTKIVTGSFALAVVAAVGGGLVGAGDRGERAGHDRADVAPATDARYRAACGECHMAFQPGLLPAAAWDRVMATLDHHFGDDAQVPPATADAVRDYLAANAADRTDGRRAAGFGSPGAGSATSLPRITETRYFSGKHHDVPARLATGNPQVRSFANCPACHQRAEAGSYNEHEVRIPGAGPWHD